ncbi:MAG: hypothetical protein ACK2UI_05290, partial [Anaerolineae bacterium]
ARSVDVPPPARVPGRAGVGVGGGFVGGGKAPPLVVPSLPSMLVLLLMVKSSAMPYSLWIQEGLLL